MHMLESPHWGSDLGDCPENLGVNNSLYATSTAIPSGPGICPAHPSEVRSSLVHEVLCRGTENKMRELQIFHHLAQQLTFSNLMIIFR